MLVRIVSIIFVAVIAAFAGFYAWAWHGEIAPVRPVDASTYDPAIVAKGAALAAVGSCVVCHSQAGGQAYAGGYPVETPFGTIYGSNITPDPDTGIGSWSQTAFRRAMHDGVDRKGRHLYPAFPYDHFTHAADTDIDAIYSYLMTRDPVQRQNREPDIPFPLNIRLAVAGWKLLFLRHGEFRPDAAQSAEWNRGAYLAEGLGHCGACHTPRNALGAEKKNEAYNGGTGEDWHAPALNGNSPAAAPWTADAAFQYLRTGWDARHGHASGPMTPVVDGLAKAPEDDVRALATYIASLSGTDDAAKAKRADDALKAARQRTPAIASLATPATTGSNGSNGSNGAAIFAGACATCHRSGGQTPSARPADLSLSGAINSPDPGNLLHIILSGIHPQARERGWIMPGFSGALTDAQIVALAGYLRTQFSDKPQWTGIEDRLMQAKRKTGS
jgi:mono/diheme cytochrome c family protein